MDDIQIQKLVDKIRSQFEHDTSGHDWHHIMRVYRTSMHIQQHEGGDAEIIALGALLHDISDHKMNGGILNHGGIVTAGILEEMGYPAETIAQVSLLVDNISFKGANVNDKTISLEQQIVQDADRLDAIGAIGIARAFAYGGHKNRPMYVPETAPELHDSFEAYASSGTHTINHFYEKLLLLKDRMHTETARKIAAARHDVMVRFLDQFYKEWNSEYRSH